MERHEAFIERIVDARQRGFEARRREEEAIAKASSDLARALGGMTAFTAMDTAAFPVTHEAVQSVEDASGMPDFGATVTALMTGASSCRRVYAQMRTSEGDEFLTVSLHPSRTGVKWVVEASSRAFDGTDWNARKEFGSAEKALSAVRARVLAMAVRTASRGLMESLPVHLEDDVAAAAAASIQIKAALEAGSKAEARRRRRAEAIARSANAISVTWDIAASRLGFLSRLGYRIGGIENGLGIVPERTGSGMRIRIASGETQAVLIAEALHDEPQTVALSVKDNAGRNEQRGQIDVSDTALLSSELEQAVLSEIEEAETAYLPERAPSEQSAPCMQ